MIYDFYELKKEFQKIKNLGKIKSLRKGSTGLGYTFETMIGKKEDTEPKPDFKSIEIKCKFYYSKYSLTLFNLFPIKDGKSAIDYIFTKYSYHRYGDFNDYRLFKRIISTKESQKLYEYSFKLFVDDNNKKIVMQSYHNGSFYENVCSWDFEKIEERLNEKMKNLAIIKAFPYTINGEKYYKYVNIHFYHLKNFDNFINLIKEGKIFVDFYIRETVNKLGDYCVKSNGVTFKIEQDNINDLFQEIII